MMTWAIVYFGKILNHLGRYSKAVAIACAFIAWLVGAIEALISGAISQLTTWLASFSVDSLGNVNFAGLEYIGYVNAIFPLSEFAAMLGIYVTAWVTVIIIRWIKSFIPTIGN